MDSLTQNALQAYAAAQKSSLDAVSGHLSAFSVSEVESGGGSCNTPPSVLQSGGEDMAWIGLGVYWPESSQLTQLDALRVQAVSSESPVLWEHAGRHFAIQPGGGRLGDDQRAMRFAICFESGGIRYGVQRVALPCGETPNVYALVGSLACMEGGGLAGRFAEVQAVIASLGGKIQFDKLSRVDICADLADDGIQELSEQCILRRFITSARKGAAYWEGRDYTGVTIGKHPLLLNIYDKAAELRDKPDPAKWVYMCRHRWGGAPETAIRAEFQIAGEKLREFGISTVQDYLERGAGMAETLFTEWFRVVLPFDRKNRHHDRAEVHPLWKKVQEAFRGWLGKAAPIRRVWQPRVDVEGLLVQALGCVLRAEIESDCGAGGTGVLSPMEVLERAFTRFQGFMMRDSQVGRYWDRVSEKACRAMGRQTTTFREMEDSPPLMELGELRKVGATC